MGRDAIVTERLDGRASGATAAVLRADALLRHLTSEAHTPEDMYGLVRGARYELETAREFLGVPRRDPVLEGERLTLKVVDSPPA